MMRAPQKELDTIIDRQKRTCWESSLDMSIRICSFAEFIEKIRNDGRGFAVFTKTVRQAKRTPLFTKKKETGALTLIENMNWILTVDTVPVKIKIDRYFNQKQMVVRWSSIDWSDTDQWFCFFSSLKINRNGDAKFSGNNSLRAEWWCRKSIYVSAPILNMWCDVMRQVKNCGVPPITIEAPLC